MNTKFDLKHAFRLSVLVTIAVLFVALLPQLVLAQPSSVPQHLQTTTPIPTPNRLPPPLFASAPAAELALPPERGQTSSQATPTFEDDIAALVNQERWDNGNLPPLKHESILHSVAHDHSVDMAEDDYVMHCDPDTGLEPWDRMTNAGYDWNYAGENIAAGYDSPEAVMNAWMNSSGHRSNILSTDFRELGAGYYYQAGDQGNVRQTSSGGCTPDSFNNGPYYHYWTQDFGKRNTVYPLVIEREAFATDTIHVQLYVYGPSDAQQMRFRNEAGAWSAWESFANAKAWTLSPGNGAKTVHVEVSTGSTTYANSDDILLDAPPPVEPPVTITENIYITLVWDHYDQNISYDVYRGDSAPYFAPGDGSDEHIASEIPPPATGTTVEFDDTTALPSSDYFYQVQALGGDDVSRATSNRVGRMVFALTPGD
ncbi:MAG TPA: CAP domain-containing protein [Caldilineae bacterium]|nr:CAP domain-containing protein [Caldilineae bacterium]